MRTYRVSLLSARLVAGTSVPVPLGAFHAAEPDPLWRYSSQTVAHLGEAHAAELLACVRAHGSPEAQAVVPRAIDRYGLQLTLLTAGGVSTLRLPFPFGPVGSAEEARVGLRAMLTCQCGTRGQRDQ